MRIFNELWSYKKVRIVITTQLRHFSPENVVFLAGARIDQFAEITSKTSGCKDIMPGFTPRIGPYRSISYGPYETTGVQPHLFMSMIISRIQIIINEILKRQYYFYIFLNKINTTRPETDYKLPIIIYTSKLHILLHT